VVFSACCQPLPIAERHETASHARLRRLIAMTGRSVGITGLSLRRGFVSKHLKIRRRNPGMEKVLSESCKRGPCSVDEVEQMMSLSIFGSCRIASSSHHQFAPKPLPLPPQRLPRLACADHLQQLKCVIYGEWASKILRETYLASYQHHDTVTRVLQQPHLHVVTQKDVVPVREAGAHSHFSCTKVRRR
jgi:hypothetical protein